MKGDALDPRALIREAYAMDGITPGECRSVFLDWALGVPVGSDPRPLVEELLARYAAAAPDHPMTQVLRDALKAPQAARRRGGRAGRLA